MPNKYHRNLLRIALCPLIAWGGYAAGYLFCPRSATAARDWSDSEQVSEEAMVDQRLAEVQLPKLTLTALADLIHDRAGGSAVAIWGRRFSFEDDALEAPPLHLHDVTLGQFLRTIQRFDHGLQITFAGNVFQLERNTGASPLLPAVSYKVDDLLQNRRLWESIGHAHDVPPPEGSNVSQSGENLLATLQDTLPPSAWRSVDQIEGFPDPSTHLEGDWLVVNELPEVQDQVADLLEVLRRIADAQKAAR